MLQRSYQLLHFIHIVQSPQGRGGPIRQWSISIFLTDILYCSVVAVDIQSRWRHNWKSAQVVNSHLVCETPQSGNHVSTSLSNSGLCWTVFARNRDIAAPAEGNGDLQTLICVLVARPRRCPTLSNPVPWQKLNGGLSRLHSADEDAVSWLTSYGSWHAYEKKTAAVLGLLIRFIIASKVVNDVSVIP